MKTASNIKEMLRDNKNTTSIQTEGVFLAKTHFFEIESTVFLLFLQSYFLRSLNYSPLLFFALAFFNDMYTSSSILSALIFTYLIKLTIRAIVF